MEDLGEKIDPKESNVKFEGNKNNMKTPIEEGINATEKLSKALQQVMVEILQDFRGQNHQPTHDVWTFKQFNCMNPPTFDGKTDPVDAEIWILEMEELLQILRCTDEQKVFYSSFKMRGEAKQWWYSMKLLLKQESGSAIITWERFKEVFFQRFFPKYIRDAKAKEFENLIQGNMTVQQYAAKFIELSRFALYMIPDELKKTRKFEEGLSPMIYNQVVVLQIKDFFELVNKATVVEMCQQRNTEMYNQRKRPMPQEVSSGRNQGPLKKKNNNLG
ncbi:uncharacterized protein LOC131167659 [Malania oleifera]|uniref:uncharacterized protein LOC131167659 n=1 Tax=Malania oleifera TaxID=397392 RepID=UPI0025AE79F4|nr:uncharacterized protein LOC131167659 [Malania oleifera]XP_057982455.1 uncharacterized protein LOC131167659 [Malania oleifera]XP_057982456.1 uncharacterized protein LOC131167659 [Malania oleifera]XP_057982457.1 uncharacterized protein LOC131167659 [Malania oleifera]